MGAYLSYVLDRRGVLGTRLLLKVVMQRTRFAWRLSLGDLVMARRQLLNLKHHAERAFHRGAPTR